MKTLNAEPATKLRHVFKVHSYISLYMALSVKEYLQIAAEDMIILSYHKNKTLLQSIPTELKTIYAPLPDNITNEGKLYRKLVASWMRKLIRFFKFYRHYREVVATLREAPYIFYCHGIDIPWSCFFATFPTCQQINLLEEGWGASTKKLWSTFKNFLAHAGSSYQQHFKWLPAMPGHLLRYFFHKQLYFWDYKRYGRKQMQICAYTISSAAYNGPFFKKFIIPFYQDLKIDLSMVPEQATIFFMDGVVDYNDYFIIDKELYFKRLEFAIKQITAPELFIKFHLGNTAKTRAKLAAFMQTAGKIFHILPDTLPSEQLLMQKQHLTVYGIRTSCLLYASAFKCEHVYSFEDYFSALYADPTLYNQTNFKYARTVYKKNGVSFLKPPQEMVEHR